MVGGQKQVSGAKCRVTPGWGTEACPPPWAHALLCATRSHPAMRDREPSRFAGP